MSFKAATINKAKAADCETAFKNSFNKYGNKRSFSFSRKLFDQQNTNSSESSIGLFQAQEKPGFAYNFSQIPVNHSISSVIQPKLIIGKPNDKYEQEADRVADEVMRMPDPNVQRQVNMDNEEEETFQAKSLADHITPLVQRQIEPREEDNEKEIVQTKSEVYQTAPLIQKKRIQRQTEKEENEDVELNSIEEGEKPTLQTKMSPGQDPRGTPFITSHIRALKGGGQPLSSNARSFFEPRFGNNLSKVRIHSGKDTANIASQINARAFSLGENIIFGEGQYSPSTFEGRRLLAHELVHVIQQNGLAKKIPAEGMIQRKVFITHTSESNATKFFILHQIKDFFPKRVGKNTFELKIHGKRPGPGELDQEIWWSLANSKSSNIKGSLEQLNRHVNNIKKLVNSAWTLIKKGAEGDSPKYPEFGSLQKNIRKKGGIRFHWLHWRVAKEYIQLSGRRGVVSDIVVESKGSPSAAIEDIWKNPKEYAYECLASVQLMQLRGYLKKVGENEFDKRFRNGITLRYSVRRGASNSGLKKLKKAGLKTIDLSGTDMYEKLVPGDMCFLEFLNSYRRSLGYGQNMIYVGGGRYYSHPLGIKYIKQIQQHWRIHGYPYQRLSKYVERW